MNKKLINKITGKIKGLDVHTKEVIKKSSSSLLVKGIGMIAGLLVSIIISRTIGASGYGIINLANKIIGVATVIALFGIVPNVIIKEIAIGYSKNDWARINNIMRSSFIFNGNLTIIIVLILVALSPILANQFFESPDLKIPLIIAALAMIPMMLSRILNAGLIGLKKIWQSNLVNETLSAVVVLIILCGLYIFNIELTVINVAIAYAIARVVVSITVFFIWRKYAIKEEQKTYNIKPLLKTAIPIFWVTLSAVIIANSDAILLGKLRGEREVGLYSVAARVAMLTSFFLQITNASVAPKIAALYAANKQNELEKMVQRVTKGLFYFGLTIWLLFLILGKWILSFWGEEFQESYWALVILGFGQFVNLTTGAVGFILIMTGLEKVQRNIAIFYMFFNVIIVFIFTYLWGFVETASATALTVSLDNITRSVLVYVKRKILVFKF